MGSEDHSSAVQHRLGSSHKLPAVALRNLTSACQQESCQAKLAIDSIHVHVMPATISPTCLGNTDRRFWEDSIYEMAVLSVRLLSSKPFGLN